jgi:O-methyltransferase involved in polyketide biosynthesis
MSEASQRPSARVSASTPSVARMNDYFVGGKDNFAIDREVAEQVLALAPEAKAMGEYVQAFRDRAVRHLAAQGVRQFVNIGVGLPTERNVHEIAQAVGPESRVVYVADDPVALNHSRALLATDERTGVVEGDILHPDELVADPLMRRLVDFAEPVAVLIFGGTLQYIPDDQGPQEKMARLRELLAPGSHLGLTHAVFDSRPDIRDAISDIFRKALDRPSGAPRTREQALRFFDGLELVEPGFVYVRQWRNDEYVSHSEAQRAWVMAGVGRKPGP